MDIDTSEKVPDAKTIWLFKDMLTKAGGIDQLFAQFNRMLEERGIITHKGTIIDATFIDAPRQRKRRDENQQIKNGEIPEEWQQNPHKMAQKIRMLAEQRNETNPISAARIMSRWMLTAS